MFGLFSRISEDGEVFYSHFWNEFWDRIFCWNFPFFILGLFLAFLAARRWRIRGGLSPRFQEIGTILWAIPLFLALWFVVSWNGGVPHFEDEFSNLYQARTISTGTYPGVVIPSELQNTFQTGFLKLASGGRLLGPYPVGFPLFLAPLDLLGLLERAQIILVGANLLVLFLLCRSCFSPRRIFPPLLLSISPFFLIHSSFLFSQSLSLMLVNIVLLRRAKNKDLGPDYLISSFLFLARPLDGLILFCALLIWQWRVQPSRRWFPLLFLVYLPLHFLHQKIHTGYWMKSTYHISMPFFTLGYGPEIGVAIPFGFNLQVAFENLGLTLLTLNETLWGWPACSVLPVLGFLWKSPRAGWHRQPVYGFSILLGTLWFAFYFNLFYPGLVVGPRYHQPLIGVFLLMTCRFLFSWREWRPVVGLAILIAALRLSSFAVENAGGVLSFPERGRELHSGVVYLAPSKGPGGKSIFRSFHHFNDPFDWEKLHFLASEDYAANEAWCRERWADKLAPLPPARSGSN